MPLDAALKKIDAALDADMRYVADNANDPVTAAAVGFIRAYHNKQGVLAKAFGKPDEARRKVSEELERLGLVYKIEDYYLQALQQYVEEKGDLPANTSKVIASAHILDRLPEPEFKSGHRVVFAINEEGPGFIGASEVAISFGPNGTCTSSKAGKVDERFGAITKKTLWILIDFPEQSELDGKELEQQTALAAVAQAIENPAAAADNFDAVIEQIQQLGVSTDIDVQAVIELVTNVVEMAAIVDANPAAMDTPAIQQMVQEIVQQLSGDTNIPPALIEAVTNTIDTLITAQPVAMDNTIQAAQDVHASAPAEETIRADISVASEIAVSAIDTPTITVIEQAVTMDAVAQDTVSVEASVPSEHGAIAINTPEMGDVAQTVLADAPAVAEGAQIVTMDAPLQEAIVLPETAVTAQAVAAETPTAIDVAVDTISTPATTDIVADIVNLETPAAIVAETVVATDITKPSEQTPHTAETAVAEAKIDAATEVASVVAQAEAKLPSAQTDITTPATVAVAPADKDVTLQSIVPAKTSDKTVADVLTQETAVYVTPHRVDNVTKLETTRTVPAAALVAQVQAIAKQLPAEQKTAETKKILQQVTSAIKSGEKISPAVQKQVEKIIAKMPGGSAKEQLIQIVAKNNTDKPIQSAPRLSLADKVKLLVTGKAPETKIVIPKKDTPAQGVSIPTKHDNNNTPPERNEKTTLTITDSGEKSYVRNDDRGNDPQHDSNPHRAPDTHFAPEELKRDDVIRTPEEHKYPDEKKDPILVNPPLDDKFESLCDVCPGTCPNCTKSFGQASKEKLDKIANEITGFDDIAPSNQLKLAMNG